MPAGCINSSAKLELLSTGQLFHPAPPLKLSPPALVLLVPLLFLTARLPSIMTAAATLL
jgi:hypothetical protein